MKKQIYILTIIALFGFSAYLNAQTDYALDFDGSNDYVQLAGYKGIGGSNSRTLEAWVKIPSTASGFLPIISYGINGGGKRLDMVLSDYGTNGALTAHTSSSYKCGTSNLRDNNWHHVAIIIDNDGSPIVSEIKLYVDGLEQTGGSVLSGSTAINTDIATHDVKIGNYTESNIPFPGEIDEARIWNDVRTEEEIKDNMYKELVGTEIGLVAYYKMSNGSGTSLTDNSPNSHTGTLNNMDNNDWVTQTAPIPYYSSQDGNWNTDATWASGQNAPTNDWANVEVKHDVTLTSAEVVEDIAVNSTKSLTINSTSSLTTDGTLTNSGTLTISSDALGAGSLITNGTITNTGTINIQRYITDGVWHLISVPNNNTTSNTFSGDYMQTWDETTATWEDITETTTALTPVQGYGFGGVAKSTIHSFEGTPNTGDQSIALSYTAVVDEGNDGANCLGNPYPSSIDWDEVSGYGAVYYWNGTAYVAYPATGSFGLGSRYIAPMQGFFIVVSSAGTFSLTNDDRTHDGASSYYKEAQEFPSNSLILKTTANNYTDELFIHFQEESSADFEMQYDAYKFLSNTEGISQLFSFTGDKKLSIDVRPETDIVQLGFKNNLNGVYQIGIKEMNGITETILEDTKADVFHNLQNGDYEFAWNTSDAETRFILHLSATAIEEMEANPTLIFAYQKTINIRSSEKLNNAQVSIIDMMGRTVYEQALVDGQNESITVPLEDGVYLVQLVSDNGTQAEKVVLQ